MELPNDMLMEIFLHSDKSEQYHLSMVNKFLNEYSKRYIKVDGDYITMCREGDLLSIVRANLPLNTLEKGMKIACQYDRGDIIDYLFDRGASNLEDALVGATRSCNMRVIKGLLNMGVKRYSEALIEAASCGHLDLFKIYFNLESRRPGNNLSLKGDMMALTLKIFGGSMIDRLLSNCDLGMSLYVATMNRHLHIVDYIIEVGHSRVIHQGLRAARELGDVDLQNLFMDLL